MINLETPKKFKAIVHAAQQAAENVFRPISRKYRARLHSLALLACSIGRAPVAQSLAIISLMESRSLPASVFTYSYAVTACLRQGAWREATNMA